MRVRHKKTGHIYSVTALAIEEATLLPVVCYTGGDGNLWVRPASEFFDGRFEVFLPHPAEAKAVALPGKLQ
ncbi:DUF1653 domain-containing protein [Sulfitobacter pontiacus]